VAAIYSHYPARKKTIQANRLPNHLELICKLLDVDFITHTHEHYTKYRDVETSFYSTRHWLLAMCNASLRFSKVKNFYWGANSGMLEFNDGLGDCSIVDPTKYQVQNVFEALQNIPQKVKGYHDADAKHHDGSYKHSFDWPIKQTISAPLIGWTKKQQWDYIRDDIKPLVQSCIHFTNCGKCMKCEEFELLNVTK
jgi:calcineurin-like phosphoesterase family protein